MRQLGLVLLALWLPLQFAWAAAAAYCQHERDPLASRHVGHHVHVHQAAAAGTDGAAGVASTADTAPDPHQPSPAKFAADTDCGYCLMAGLSALLPPLMPAAAPEGTAGRPAAHAGLRMASVPPRTPDRPQWRRTVS